MSPVKRKNSNNQRQKGPPNNSRTTANNVNSNRQCRRVSQAQSTNNQPVPQRDKPQTIENDKQTKVDDEANSGERKPNPIGATSTQAIQAIPRLQLESPSPRIPAISSQSGPNDPTTTSATTNVPYHEQLVNQKQQHQQQLDSKSSTACKLFIQSSSSSSAMSTYGTTTETVIERTLQRLNNGVTVPSSSSQIVNNEINELPDDVNDIEVLRNFIR